MINVTKPFLPPIDEYKSYIDKIWQRNWLTSNGPLVNELELQLKNFLNIDHLLFTGNGTIALQIAINALGLKGDIITTPFSFVATTSSIVWEGCNPVFVDIDPLTWNIDPLKIESAITDNTCAILATHIFGNPCDIDAIDLIAKKHNLRVVYDAAHCFGTKYRGRSVFSFGDITTASFHATKLYHSIEGGALMTKDSELLKKMAFMRNFGFNGPGEFAEIGINGKNSEFHAAMGLCNLKYIDSILKSRAQICKLYFEKLNGLSVERISLNPEAEWNSSYFPIVFQTEELLLKSIEILNSNWIYPRRYFYPSLSKLNYVVKQNTPISDDISKRILCLPVFCGLTEEDISFISRLLLRAQNN